MQEHEKSPLVHHSVDKCWQVSRTWVGQQIRAPSVCSLFVLECGSPRESGCRRPVSRVLSPPEGRGMAIPLGRASPRASRDLPGRPARKRACARPPRAAPSSLLGLAPGGVCRAAAVAAGAVRSYRTLSPLPAGHRSRPGGRFALCGTFPGVAPAGRYPAPCFRGARTFLPRLAAGAAIRPPAPGAR